MQYFDYDYPAPDVSKSPRTRRTTAMLIGALVTVASLVLMVSLFASRGRFATKPNHSIELRPERVIVADQQPLRDVEYSPNGKLLATASLSGAIKVWNTRNYGLVRKIQPTTRSVTSVSFVKSSTLLAVATDFQPITIWSLSNGQPVTRLPLAYPDQCFQAVAISHNGHLLAGADANGVVTVWDAASWHRVQTLGTGGPPGSGTFSPIWELEFAPHDDLLGAAGGDTGQSTIWNLKTSTTLSIGVAPRPMTVRFSPNGRFLAVGQDSGPVEVWDLQHAKAAPVSLGNPNGSGAIAFSPYSKWLACSPDSDFEIWDTTHWHLAYKHHNAAVNSANYSPTGSEIALADDSGKVEIWRITK